MNIVSSFRKMKTVRTSKVRAIYVDELISQNFKI